MNSFNNITIKCLICASHCSGDIMVNGLDKILLSWKHWRVVCLKITVSGWVSDGCSLIWVFIDLSEEMTMRLALPSDGQELAM